MKRWIYIFLVGILPFEVLSAYEIEESAVWSVAAGPVHSQLDGYLGGSVWGGQLKGLISYKGIPFFQALTGMGYRADGGEGILIHRAIFPFMVGPRLCYLNLCSALTTGLELTFSLGSQRDSDFYVPRKADIKIAELLWPNALEVTYLIQKDMEFGVAMNATMGITPAIAQRSGELKTMILAPELILSIFF